MFRDVFEDQTHRALAEAMLTSAGSSNGITVESVAFGDRDPEAAYSWLCYIADPAAADLVAGVTARSASDHFKRYNPNNVLTNSGRAVAARVYEIEVSGEAPFVLVDEDGRDTLVSPWLANLVVVKAMFNYTTS